MGVPGIMPLTRDCSNTTGIQQRTPKEKEASGTPIHPPMTMGDPVDNVTLATASPSTYMSKTYGGKPGDDPGLSGRKQEKTMRMAWRRN